MNRQAPLSQRIRIRLIVSLVVMGGLISLLSAIAMQEDDTTMRVLIFVAVAALIGLTVWRFSTEIDSQVAQMTERLESETATCRTEAGEATGTLSNFMYYIAHVLRTPVNAIRWSVESMKNEDVGPISEDQREVLDTLEASAVKLASVASELQDTLLVIRGEPIHMNKGPCDIPSLIDAAAGHAAVAMRRKRLTLDWQHPTKPLDPVRCDPARIEQVMSVLLDNAVKYSEPERRIKIEARAEGSNAIVTVADEGIGIPKDEQMRIFSAFFRGEQARELWVDGKGIGLTIAKAIIEECGGELTFSSRKGKGTVMRAVIPTMKAA